MLAIGGAEFAALLIGFSPSSAIESALPEVDVPDVDAPEPSAAELGPLSVVLSWFSVGRMPILVLLVIFLTTFGLAGYLVQGVALSSFGSPLNAWLAAVPAVVAASYATRHLGRLLGRLFPRDHTEAASQAEMIGSYATILRGEARKGQPAEARTHDLRGRTHYVLIEPDDPATRYVEGDRVFIVGKDRNIYRAVTKISTRKE